MFSPRSRRGGEVLPRPPLQPERVGHRAGVYTLTQLLQPSLAPAGCTIPHVLVRDPCPSAQLPTGPVKLLEKDQDLEKKQNCMDLSSPESKGGVTGEDAGA